MKCLLLTILSCALAIQGKPYGYGINQIGYQAGGGGFGSNFGAGAQGGYQSGGFDTHASQGSLNSAQQSSKFTSYVNSEQSTGLASSGGSSFGASRGGQAGFASQGLGSAAYGQQGFGGGFNTLGTSGMGLGGVGVTGGLGLGTGIGSLGK